MNDKTMYVVDSNTLKAMYRQGYIDGMTCFAWWKDGTQYCGTTGTTLKEALKNCGGYYNFAPETAIQELKIVNLLTKSEGV